MIHYAEKQSLRFAFRQATARDIDAISDLHDKAFSAFVDTRETYAMFANALADTQNSELIAATDNDGNIAGFLLLGAEHSMVRGGLNVDVVAVDDKYRGQGLGRALMEKAEEIALQYNFNTVTLQVHEDNAAAIGLYKKMDYRTKGRHNRYYCDGKSAIEMHKRVTPRDLPFSRSPARDPDRYMA